MKAIILAAGKGNRLIPLTHETPKTLIPIQGIPIITRIFLSLPPEIDTVIMVVEHLKEKIKSFVGNTFYNHKVQYVDQIPLRGTFGALLSTRNLLEDGERFLVINGDDIHDISELSEYIKYPRAFGLQNMNMPGYHSIHLDEKNNIEGFYPQTEYEKKHGALVATGAYVIDTDIFKHPGVKLSDGEYGLPQTLLSQKDTHPIKGIVTTRWLPINSFADIERGEKILKTDINIIPAD